MEIILSSWHWIKFLSSIDYFNMLLRMKGRWWRIKSNRYWFFLREPKGFTQVHDRRIKPEGFSPGVSLAFGQFNSLLCGRPPKDKMCSISGPWPPNAHSTHQPSMWPPRLHFKCQLEGASVPCRDEMITILPLLKPHSEKNVRGKISTFLSEAKFLTNPLDWPNTRSSSGCCVRKAEGYM